MSTRGEEINEGNRGSDSFSTKGEELVFLITQPRTGSTLLQRILGSHPDIHTASEPWLMLHPVYALRENGWVAEYDEHLSRLALQNFLDQIPGEKEAYREGIRRMYGYLYHSALAPTNASYFLDKTPRYYYIIGSLYEIFPNAHYIILLRNPLSILASYLSLEDKEPLDLNYNRHDLTRAPRRLIEARDLLPDNVPVVHYGELVRNPESVIRNVCESIGIPFKPDIIEYSSSDQSRWMLGDPENVYKRSRPTTDSISKWRRLAEEDAQYWRLFSDYLDLLGRKTFEALGYSFDELSEALEHCRPRRRSLVLTVSLPWLLKRSNETPHRWESLMVRIMRWLRN